MIEKLKRPVKIGGTTFREKINELIDAVNKLDALLDLTNTAIQAINKTELEHIADVSKTIDPYAEQRKWIGKVCWFWDDDNTNSSCGILTSIDTETFKEPQFVCNDEYDYNHCEPVKPDDDIIYKGGKDE